MVDGKLIHPMAFPAAKHTTRAKREPMEEVC
jgi:hypothetical protein